jgi:hypothetical protein
MIFINKINTIFVNADIHLYKTLLEKIYNFVLFCIYFSNRVKIVTKNFIFVIKFKLEDYQKLMIMSISNYFISNLIKCMLIINIYYHLK